MSASGDALIVNASLGNAEHQTEQSKGEEWRSIAGWERQYEVSSLGRVRSLDRTIRVSGVDKWRAAKTDYFRFSPGQILVQCLDGRGYPKVGLHFEGRMVQARVHRLVCEAFHGPPPSNADAAHNDGTRTNNLASNLRWATRSENLADRIKHGTDQRGERGSKAVLSTEEVAAIRVLVDRGSTQASLARRYGVSTSTINLIVSRRNWKHVS